LTSPMTSHHDENHSANTLNLNFQRALT